MSLTYKKNPDIDIIGRIKSGDRSALKVLFDKYYASLTRFGFLYVKDKDIAEEIVQEFFVHFWIKRESLSINNSIKSYLYRSVRNKCLNYNRDTKKNLSIESELELIDTLGFSENVYEVDYDELKEMIEDSIESLPQKCKDIFKLSRMQQLTYKQISDKLNISQKTVENQIGIALKKLRKKLEPILSGLISIAIYIF